MTKEEFADTFMEGVMNASSFTPNFQQTAYNLVQMLYDSRKQVRYLQDKIEVMDDVARENLSTVKCCGCDEYYDIPCELSEFNPDMSYCGRSPRCCP